MNSEKLVIKNKTVRLANDEEKEMVLKFYNNFLSTDRGINPYTKEPLLPERTQDEEIEMYFTLKMEMNIVHYHIELSNGNIFRLFSILSLVPDAYGDIDFFYTNIQICENDELVRLNRDDEFMSLMKNPKDYLESPNRNQRIYRVS